MAILPRDTEPGDLPDCPTVRRYPRTLADAFPDERAHCVEPWLKESATQSARRLIPMGLWLIAAFFAAVFVFAAGLTKYAP